MSSFREAARLIASTLVAARQSRAELLSELDLVLGRSWRWTRPFVGRYLAKFGTGPRPRSTVVATFISQDAGFRRAFARHGGRIRQANLPRVQMSPLAASPAAWNVPPLVTTVDLARQLRLSLGQLDWLANGSLWNRSAGDGNLHHYRYKVIRKRRSGLRLIEAPKPMLKAAQRWVLHEIVAKIPPHEAAHGFRRERGIHTFAAPHVGRAVVLKLDLQDFFPTVRAAQVHAIFRTAGYPEAVADRLTGLCTNATPEWVWDAARAESHGRMPREMWLYREPHLPQGAPTSPALANLAAFRLDCRLSQLARAAGASYSRYADDLAFSGGEDFARRVKRFYVHVAATVEEEGFRVHYRKTQIMRPGVRQQVAGLVVNHRLNVRRSEFERLKATLFNCIRHGPASQNLSGIADFRAHLLGRMAFMARANANRGEKLRSLYEKIDW